MIWARDDVQSTYRLGYSRAATTRPLFMKLLWAFLILIPALACAQQPAPVWGRAFGFAMDSADVASGQSVFKVAKPDIIVTVTKHNFGADLFEVTAVAPGYPVDLIQKQAMRLGEILGNGPTALLVGSVVIGGDQRLKTTKATFAVNGIIDREKGTLRITPIVQAFVGAPAPYTVHGITILFNGEVPTSGVLRSYSTPGIRLQAVADQSPTVIEYRIQLLTQDPKELELPDTTTPEQKPPPTPSTVQQSGVDWTLWIALIAAAAAVGILVYFLMLRASAKPSR